jgi:hypothetical protein
MIVPGKFLYKDELVICNNVNLVRRFDGREYLSVHYPDNPAQFLVARDELTPVVE